ncbi:MAG: PEGA domain-containing protein [Labilithrix sp.]|nr:PEGA domain-containing protein [Labilithrix sp.]
MRTRALTLAVVMALVPVASAHADPAPGKEHAKQLFDEGLELEKKNDFAAALAKYREAKQITVTPGLRFHEGYCLEMTGKLAAALEEYEAAEKMAREQNKQDVRSAVVARLDPLRARVPQLAIRLATPAKDAEVKVDGVAVAAPLLGGKSFRLDPGDHTVTAHAPGYKPFSRSVKVPEAVTTTVDISLDAVERPVGVAVVAPAPVAAVDTAPPPIEPPREEAPRRSVALPIATTVGAVALAAGGIAMFAVAGGAASDAERDCPSKVSCDDERSRVRTFDTLALGGFIGAAAFGVISVVLWTRTSVVATPTSAGIRGTW